MCRFPRPSDGAFDLNIVTGPPRPVDPEAIITLEVDTSPRAPEPPAPPATAPAPAEAEAAAAEPAKEVEKPKEKAEDAGPKLRRKKRPRRRGSEAPAWLVSALIHLGILGGLALVATGSGEIIKRLPDLNSSVLNAGATEELTPLLGDPSDAPRDMATGDTSSSTTGPSVGFASNIGGAAPSATPSVSKAGRAVGEKTSLPTIASIAAPSGLKLMPSRPTADLGGGGKIGGDVTFTAGDVGAALDQIAREILRHVGQHKVVVAWMFDESVSMRDDQKEVKKRFDRVVNELKINTPDEEPPKGNRKRSAGPPLSHAIVGFGDDVHFEQEKPTADIESIGKAIDHLRVDSTGKENTMSAVAKVISHYGNLISSDRKLLIVLVTDESGDDGEYVEEARQAAIAREVPVYVIGRQALFGFRKLQVTYKDPVTKDNYWVHIDRGPETADVEALQWDGIHTRWDEQPSGFAPYELARLAKDTTGIYFLLPSEEESRTHRREMAYSMATLKEYVPDYESRTAYAERRQKSEFRRTLYEIIQETRKYPFRHAYPVIPAQMLDAVAQDLPGVTERLNILIAIEKRLRGMEKNRNRETERRWQAAYDLMLAQIVTYQIKAYEYRACLLEMQANPPKPSKMPTPELTVAWWLNHSHEMKAPKEKTEKVYAEAMRLLKLVIERHPKTPWADLAQDEINRGFSVHRDEHQHKHDARYEERAKLVPKF